MDGLIKATADTMAVLSQMEDHLKEGSSPTAESLGVVVNDLVSKLDELNKAGNETYTQVPVELLVHLDEEPMQATPETFQAHKLGARVEEKKAIDARIDYLKQLQTALAQIPASSSVTEG